MTPNPEEWSFDKQQETPPRLLRLQQIHALREAFILDVEQSIDIQSDIEIFYTGDFNKNIPIENYSSLYRRRDKTIAGSKFCNLI